MSGIGIGTARLRARNRHSAAIDIQAILAPASSGLVAGEALEDTANWSVFLDPANYVTAAPAAAIASVEVNYTGSTASATEPLSDGDVNAFSITVRDTIGQERTFTVLPRTVRHSPPAVTGTLEAQNLTTDTGLQNYDASGAFTGAGLVFAVSGPAGVSIGAGSGLLSFDTGLLAVQSDSVVTVTASNSGGSAQANLALTVAPPASLSATLDPSGAQALTSNQRGRDITGLADFLDPANYTSSLGTETINPPEFQVNGVTSPDTVYFHIGDEISVRVTGSLGTERRFVIDDSVAAPAGTTAVFLLIGQSNMVGRPTFDGGAGYPAGTIQYDQSNIRIPAATPLDHVNETAGDMGLALQFVIDYKAANPTHDVVLVPRAEGNTGFQDGRWIAGSGPNYLAALSDVNTLLAAHPEYSFAGFLWHQGEADAAAGAASYADRLSTMIDAFRANVTGATDTTPFVLGELSSNNGAHDEINSLINIVGDTQAYCTVADATGLTTFDTVHFDAASLRILGARYFAAHEAARTDAPALPGQVTGLAAAAGDGQVALSWDLPAANGAAVTDYVIAYSGDGGASWITVAKPVSALRAYTVDGLSNGTAYQFRVSAVNAEGTGQPSDILSATPAASVASGPVLLTSDWAESHPGTNAGATTGDVSVTLDVGAPNADKTLFITAAGLIDEGQALTLTVGGTSATVIPGGSASASNVALYPFRLDAPGLSGNQTCVLSGFAANRLDVALSCVAVENAGAAGFASDFAENAIGTVDVDVPENGALIVTGLNANGGATVLSGVATQTDGTSSAPTPGGDDLRSGEVFSAGYEFGLSQQAARTVSASSAGGQVLGVITVSPPVGATVTPITAENSGDELLFTLDDSVAEATPVPITYDGTEYTTDYLGTTITAGLLRGGIVTLTRPVITGTTGVGDTLTVVPAIQVYPGDDPGTQTFRWQRGGVDIAGATGTTYTIALADENTDLTVEQDYGGTTVESLATSILAGGTWPKTTTIASGLDTAANALDVSQAFTPQAGTNRLLYLVVQAGLGAGIPNLPTATLNGQAFTQDYTDNMDSANRAAIWQGYIKDADLSAGTLSVTFPGNNGADTVNTYAITLIELDNVDQTTPIGSTVRRTDDFGGAAASAALTLTGVSANSRILSSANWVFEDATSPDITTTTDSGGSVSELAQYGFANIAIEDMGASPPASVGHTATFTISTTGPHFSLIEINRA